MQVFPKFLEVYGAGHDCKTVDQQWIDQHKDVIPEPLLEFLRTEGICGYLDGMFWFVDPDAFADVLDEWDAAGHTAFARNGFGDLFLHSGEGVSVLSVHQGTRDVMTPDITLFINRLIPVSSVMDDLMFRKIHKAVVGKLGRPAADECYAFVPALALGGPGTPESVQRVKLREQLSILAQIHDH